MAHVRTQLRIAVKTHLLNQTAAATRVYLSRAYPGQEPALPLILVYSQDEQSQILTQGGDAPHNRRLGRETSLIVHGLVKDSADVDAAMDGLAAQIEARLGNPSPAIADLAMDLWLESTQLLVSGEGKQPIGNCRMVWKAVVHTAAADAETAI